MRKWPFGEGRGMQGAVQEVKENFLPVYLVCNHNSYK
jgi:hypothetical protein